MGVDPVDLHREAIAKLRITELLNRRGRASDVKDADAVLREHVPGSRDNHGVFNGTIEEFAEFLRTHNYADSTYGVQRHTISNVLIEFDGPSSARVESYHLAYHRMNLSSGTYDVHIGGRYFDHCVELKQHWLLQSRQVVYDWSRSARVIDNEAEEEKHDG
jgi:hypothetical protein